MSSVSGAEHLLSHALSLIPAAADGAAAARWFPGRWRAIAALLDQLPASLSDLSTHPFFARHPLCAELLQSISAALSDAADLAARCAAGDPPAGKLRTQSDLDALASRLGVALRDCSLLVKTGVLTDPAAPEPPCPAAELLARVQIGPDDAKRSALDNLLDSVRDMDEKSLSSSLGPAQVSALVHLLASSSSPVKEKTAALISSLPSCDSLLVSQGILPPLIALADSGTLVGREKAVISLHRLSASPDNARSIAELHGIRPLLEACITGDSITQSSAAGVIKNLSFLPELGEILAKEGVIGVMINLIDTGTVLASKEYAAECLRNLSSQDKRIRTTIISGGGVRSLLLYLNSPTPPQESTVAALRNLVGLVSIDTLMSHHFLPRMLHVLNQGSPGAQQAAASAICVVSSAMEVKRSVLRSGILAILVRMLDGKENRGREVAAQAIGSLIAYPPNRREVKRDEKGIPNLVQLLNPDPQNSAAKYAVSCLLQLSSSKKCRKVVIAYGGIGYLKKLLDMDVPGSKKLLQRLERRKLGSLFGRK